MLKCVLGSALGDCGPGRARRLRCIGQPIIPMTDLSHLPYPLAAIGYSILYLLFGGGLLGAIVIFVIAKMFRR